MDEKRLQNIPLRNIHIHDQFWDKYIGLVESVILPFEWDLINDRVPGAEKSYCMQNFRVAGGLEKGTHQGTVFQDTDVAKWLEAAAYSLAKKPDQELEKTADAAIDLIIGAQEPDGYLNTYNTILGKGRFYDLFEGHELYTAGHMIEAAVAYAEATGKRKFVNSCAKLADYLCSVFGPEEGKIHGYPGHPEIELALYKLYKYTGKQDYLRLAQYFLDVRGQQPCYFLSESNYQNGTFIFKEFKDFGMDYCQADRPLAEQDKAEGHAVRAVYLYSGMADVAAETGDERMLRQCEMLWENIVSRQMYVTGSIGSAAYGERFTTDYDLPNNTNYSESCATIGLAMFSNRLFQITRDGKYMDVVELALYNTLLSGIALDGRHFFYVNPLECVPEVAEHNPTMRHVKTERQLWFGCACCPPNITRTLASMGNYMFHVGGNTAYINLYLAGEIEAPLSEGTMRLTVEADYPASGSIRIRVQPEKGRQDAVVALRLPAYSVERYTLLVNGQKVSVGRDDADHGEIDRKDIDSGERAVQRRGYLYLSRSWQDGDLIELDLDVAFRFVYGNPKVRDDIGKVCIMRGPSVYCFEEADNGAYLAGCRIDTSAPICEEEKPELLGGTLCAVVSGSRIDYRSVGSDEPLYSAKRPVYQPCHLKAIPYACWNNRGKGEMQVWMREE